MRQQDILYKAELTIADFARQYFAQHRLTLARHPSETDERLMMRLIAFALHADTALRFTRGLCVADQPDLWQISPSGEIETWIEVGLPKARPLIKASRRAQRVFLYVYGHRAVDAWWSRQRTLLTECPNLTVRALRPPNRAALEALVERWMSLVCTIEDDRLLLANARLTVPVAITTLHG